MEGTPLTNTQDKSESQDTPNKPEQSPSTENIANNLEIQSILQNLAPNVIEEKDDDDIQVPLHKKKYAKISNEQRLELIDSVENHGQNIKQAAKRLSLNYSSAKSICQVFKKEGRSKKKAFKQRFAKEEDSRVDLSIPNPPCDNPELKALLEPESNITPDAKKTADNSTQKSTLMELRDKLTESRLVRQKQENITSETSATSDSVRSAKANTKSGMENKYSQTGNENSNQEGETIMYPSGYGNNTSPQMQQNNTYNNQPQQTFMIFQGNMQPFMGNNNQPMYQNNGYQGYFTPVQQPSESKDQNQQQNLVQQNEGYNQNMYTNNNPNNYGNFQNPQTSNNYIQMIPVNQPQFYMTPSYFVGGPNDNNNNNNYNNQPNNNMYQFAQPIMYMQPQPNYYVQSFTTTNDIYLPQQGGYFVVGENQNQAQGTNQGDFGIKGELNNGPNMGNQ